MADFLCVWQEGSGAESSTLSPLEWSVYLQAAGKDVMEIQVFVFISLTLMESILVEGKVAINLFFVQTSDGDILGGSAGGIGGKTGIWGNRVSCISGLYVGRGNEVHGCEAVVMAG